MDQFPVAIRLFLIDVPLVLLEHQDRVGTDRHQEDRPAPDQGACHDPAAGANHVLIQHLAQAVAAVQHRQVDHCQVPEPPEGRRCAGRPIGQPRTRS